MEFSSSPRIAVPQPAGALRNGPGIARALARPLRAMAILATLSLGACAQLGLGGGTQPPIVFVPASGESAAQWQTTIWRFESNGWPRNRLYAFDVPYSLGRDGDAQPRLVLPATSDPQRALQREVDRVLATTGARKVVLVGDSRSAQAIRDYVTAGDGATKVSHAVLGGAAAGEVVAAELRPGGLLPGGLLRQAAPALARTEGTRGARGFEQAWLFITGESPSRTAIVAETAPVLDGRISPPETNLPLAGVLVEVYEVAPQTGERLGPPAHVRTTGADGRWGPMSARSDAPYEFVLTAPGFAITHIYRSAFPRSSSVVDMRPARLADADRNAGSVITMLRPRGYFDPRRDRMNLDGSVRPAAPSRMAGALQAKLVLSPGPVRTVVAAFDGERIAVRSWPASENRVVIAELHY